MPKISSSDQIRQFISKVRGQRKGFVTNFYWDANKHPYWVDNGELVYDEYGDKCVLLRHLGESFCNVFFIATDYEAVTSSLRHHKDGLTQVIDLVCKGDGLKEREIFRSSGFLPYRNLYRMSHIGPIAAPDWDFSEEVEYAATEDATAINGIFQRDFDSLCEQLPSIREIEDFASRSQILVVKQDKRILGFLIFELIGATWYLRYWYTSPECRNQGIGSKLLKSALVSGKDSRRQMLWVLSDNENAIKRYRHLGFTREDMNDYVLIKQNQI